MELDASSHRVYPVGSLTIFLVCRLPKGREEESITGQFPWELVGNVWYFRQPLLTFRDASLESPNRDSFERVLVGGKPRQVHPMLEASGRTVISMKIDKSRRRGHARYVAINPQKTVIFPTVTTRWWPTFACDTRTHVPRITI